ncbi:MAG: fibronectin type III domain-containing protein [Patescibacteria group bacterium]|nr:fibronectin type III domain-containing protein [Patescibacteria group bacterium]
MRKYPQIVAWLAVIFVASFFAVGTAKASVLSAPYLTAPASNQTLTNYPRQTTFTWDSVSHATKYEVEVTCDVCVSKTNKWQGAKTYSTTARTLTVTMPGDNQFRWRVRAYDGATAGYWSDYKYFRFNTSAQTPVTTAPVITVPGANQTMDWDSTDFHWNSVVSAQTYFITVEYSSNGVWKNFVDYQTSNNYVIGEGIWDNSYRVKIRAQLSNNTYTNWSEWRYFKVDTHSGTDLTVPSLLLPTDEAHLTSNNVTLDWSVVAGATAYQYQVTRNNGSFWVLVVENTITASDTSVTLSSGVFGQYSFRVRAFRNGSYGGWSEYNHFYYDNGSHNYDAPVITAPWQGQVFNDHLVNASWTSNSGAQAYEMDLDYFSNGAWVNKSNTSVYNVNPTLNISDDNKYRFRVRAHFTTSVYSDWSDWREFTVGTNNNTTAPVIYTPAQNAVVENGSRMVSLSWSGVSGVTGYIIEMTCDGYGTETIYPYLPFGAVYNLYAVHGDDTWCHFRVRANLGNGNFTTWSDYRYFHYKYNSNSNGISVYNPTEDQYLTYHTVYSSWTAVPSAYVYAVEVNYKSGNTWYVYGTPDGIYGSIQNSLNFNVTNDGYYRLRARAKFWDNSYGDWSDWREFMVGPYGGGYDHLDDAPLISMPNAGQTFTGRNVYATWSNDSHSVSYEINVNYKSGTGWYEERTQTAWSNFATMYFSYDNNYRMRVRTKFSDGAYSNWSDWREFSVNAGGSSNGNSYGNAPVVYTPANNAAINQSSRSVNLGWYSVSNAQNYDVEVACDYCNGYSSQWALVNTYITGSNSYSYWAPGTDNTYRFRVRAKLNNSTYTPWSDYRSFHYFQTAQ